MRVMLDTNILVSAIFFPSEQTKAIVRELSENHRIVLCDYVIKELRLVTERKFPKLLGALDRFFIELPFELIYTPNDTPEGTPVIRDVKDQEILNTAIAENIDIFLTGDKDFLVLDIGHPEIMTMSEFEEKYTK